MDPQFQRILVRVLIVGGVIMAIGAGTLILAFRAFGAEKSDRDFRASLLVAVVLAFVLIACVVLLRIATLR